MKLRILIAMLVSSLGLNAQNCDIAQTGMGVYNALNTAPVSTIMTGQRANLKFTIANLGTKMGCSIPANTVTADLAFASNANGQKPYAYEGPASFSSGYFSWTYDPATEVLHGVNSQAIPTGKGDAHILIKVKALLPGIAHSTLNLTQGSGLSDNDANNYSAARIMVMNNPVPIKLGTFTAVADKCNALLNWATVSESNFSHFDIEYSPDAVTYIKVGSVFGKNLANGAAYKFGYSQLSGNGYYRLKIVDRDGAFEYSDVARAKTSCNDQAKVLVYPNPLSYDQKLFVNISGYSGKISGELFNEAGQRVGVYELTNNTNELSVIKQSAGTYMLYVRSEEGRTESFKIIITR